MLLQKPNTTVFLDTADEQQAVRMKALGWKEVSKKQAEEAVSKSVESLDDRPGLVTPDAKKTASKAKSTSKAKEGE